MNALYYRIRAWSIILLSRILPRDPPVVFRGADSALRLCREMPLLGFQRVLLVTDKVLLEAGLLEGITRCLSEGGIKVAIFDGVLPDPTFDQVKEGESLLSRHDAEAVLAVGGGSVLDAAKMIAMLHTNPGALKSFLPVQHCKHPGVPLFAVPTTAGTGSEVTPAAVISDAVTHIKTQIVDTKMAPDYVALDAGLMRTMPAGITAATGMDALTHAVESYLSRAATADTDRHAVAAVRLIFRYLPDAWRNGDDLDAREAMALAAFYAGAAFGRTSVGYVHAVAHQLGRVCGTPHGNANAMVLPEVLALYGSTIHPRLAQLARRSGLAAQSTDDKTAADGLIRAIADLRARLKLPILPRGLKDTDVQDIVKQALAEAGEFYPVPRYLGAEEIRTIVRGLLPASQPKKTELKQHG